MGVSPAHPGRTCWTAMSYRRRRPVEWNLASDCESRPPAGAATALGRSSGQARAPALLSCEASALPTMHAGGTRLIACEHHEGVDVDVARARDCEHDAIRDVL